MPNPELKAQHAQEFYEEVCREAEETMMKTNRLEGSHYAAMQRVLARWKNNPDEQRQAERGL